MTLSLSHNMNKKTTAKQIERQALLSFSPSFFTHVLWLLVCLGDLQSHALLQTYGAILPTSLTYIVSIDQRLFTLETCCGYWYGQKRLLKTQSRSPNNKEP